MLELPEVEVLRKDLEKEIVGKTVTSVDVRTAGIVKPLHRTRPELVKALEGRKIEGVRRKGTVLFVDLDEGQTWVLDLVGTATLHREVEAKDVGPDCHLVVTFNEGDTIRLSDPTSAETVSTGVVATEGVVAAVGINPAAFDPFNDQLTWMDFGRTLAEAAMPIRHWITDPNHVIGIKEVYADEILYEAGLRWDHATDKLSTQEVRRLYRAILEVIAAAIKFRGVSLDDNTSDDAVDEDGEVSEHLKVYGRDGLPSFRSRKPIVRERIKKGTYTYYDPQSQI